MNQPSLFDDDAGAGPKSPPHLRDDGKPGKAPKVAPPLRAPLAEPNGLPHGFAGFPIRAETARLLGELGAEYAAGLCTEDELYRSLRGCLYVLTAAELVAVAEWIATLVRTTDERLGTGTARSAGAGRTAELLQDAGAGGAHGE